MSSLSQLLTLKQTNLNLIVDLLNTPNIDAKKLQEARDTHNFLNYQLEKYKSKVPSSLAQLQPQTVCSNLPQTLFKADKEDTSIFATFNGPKDTGKSNINRPTFERYNFAKQAASLFPQNPIGVGSIIQNLTIPMRNKEEIIFKPSQEQLNGVERPVLPEDLFNLTKVNYPVKNMYQDNGVQHMIPLKPDTQGDDLKRLTEFSVIPGLETEIEQSVKADLAKLSLEFNIESDKNEGNKEITASVPVSQSVVVPLPECEGSSEMFYDNPYDDYN